MKNVMKYSLLIVAMLGLAACGTKENQTLETIEESTTMEETVEEASVTMSETEMTATPESETETIVIEQSEMETYSEEEIEVPETIIENPVTATVEETGVVPAVNTSASDNGILIAIDAGHQGKGNYDKEPVGPGAAETKAKVSSGTSGCVSGLAEYQLNLILALKLEAELKARGYEVLMIRTTHDVNISNAERAMMANEAGADAFIRIHANGSEDSSVHGAMTLCQTSANPYNGALYGQSKALSNAVLDGVVNATGCNKQRVWETDTMSGINWCQVPVTIVEVGYMSNPNEDMLLATEEYQNKLVLGMANGIEQYFAGE